MGQPGLEARKSGSRAQAHNHCASLLSNATEGSNKMKTEKVCCFRKWRELAVFELFRGVESPWVKMQVVPERESRPTKCSTL